MNCNFVASFPLFIQFILGNSNLLKLNTSKAKPVFLHTHLSPHPLPTIQYYTCICLQTQWEVVCQLDIMKDKYFIYSLSSNERYAKPTIGVH